jgi:RHS repeat-associated protein
VSWSGHAIGRVVSVVHAPDSTAITDSVHYDYDALNRVQQMTRTTAKYDGPGDLGTGVDIVTFTYDSVTLSTGKQWCSRLLKMQGVMGAADTTVTRYGASGVARCLPTMVIGPSGLLNKGDTTKFAYGTLAAGQSSATRPTAVTPQVGPGMTMQYDAGTWNSKVSTRTSDNAATTAWYNPFGRPDSVKAPDAVRTWIQYDLSGRIVRQKTGSGLTAPTTATTYDASGNVTRTDVYPSPDNNLTTQSSPPQTTLTYYDRLNRVDSVISPGTRPNARKQSYIRDVYGNPFYEFSGNGAYVGRVYDWQGRLSTTYHSFVDPSRSVDGEQFADADALSVYNFLSFTLGPALSTGEQYLRKYDNKGNEVYARGQEVYLGDSLYARKRAYSRRGLLIADTLIFMDGLRIARAYQYDRRGLRTTASDVVTALTGPAPQGDASGQIDYTYDLAGRLLAETGQAAGTRYARAEWLYDLGGRDTLQRVLLGSSGLDTLRTRHGYDASGRDALIHTSTGSVAGADWYDFSFPVYDIADQLKSYNLKETHTTTTAAQLGSATLTYATDGTRRLKQSSKTVGSQTRGYLWTYDVAGNQTNEAATSSGGTTCTDTDTMTVAADNRLQRRWSPACPGTITRYWSDQAGNRLATADSITTVRDFKATMTYTAANQLYYTLTPTAGVGSYDLNWHWYDADGMRIVSHVSGVSLQSPLSIPTNFNPNTVGGWRTYNFYDGSDVALVVAKSGGGSWIVRQRFLSSGTDQPLAGRFLYNGVSKNLALVADRMGTTMVAVQPGGQPELNAQFFDRSPFGSLEGATGMGGTVNPETGFGGATTPNQSGGFTYLRNRWYDPQTGRFLTQDPIGLSGGVNLYAYAGNNPVAYTDPFGLCPPDNASLADCPADKKFILMMGQTLRGGEQALQLYGAAIAAAATGVGIVEAITAAPLTMLRLAPAGPAVGKLLAPERGEKLSQMIARWGEGGGRDAFMRFAQGFADRATRAGTYVAGRVGPLENAKVYREGNNYIVVDEANRIRSYVQDARAGEGIVSVYERLGGK